MRKYLFIVGVFLGLSSCENSIVVADTIATNGTWDKDQELTFDIPSLDSLSTYHMYLNVRNSNDYPYSNLHLIVSITFPHGRIVTDTLEYRMAAPDGTWLGNGIGSIKENKLWYKENVTFLEEGTYQLRISHAVRNNGEAQGVTELTGITDVGYSIEKASK